MDVASRASLSQVDSMTAMAARPANATRLPEACDFHLDYEKSRKMDAISSAHALTVCVAKPKTYQKNKN